MANLFEKPIAANPISEFAALPLDFIYKAVQNRQQKYDTAKADIEATEESLLGLKFLPGDRERHMEIQQGYEQDMDDIIDSSGGDYSLIQAPLDRLKRRISRDISYGEIGAQQRAYNSAMADHEILNKRDLEGKLNSGGMQLFNQSMQEHRTLPTKSGGFNGFNGYKPSNITKPLEFIHNTIDEINDQYNPDGTKEIGEEHINNTFANMLQTDPNIIKSLKEIYATSGMQENMSFKDYVEDVRKKVVKTKMYKEETKSKDATGNFANTTVVGAQVPRATSGKMKGTGFSMIELKEIFGAAGEAQKFFASTSGQNMVQAIERSTGKTFPTDGTISDKVDFVEAAMEEAQNRTMNITVHGDVTNLQGAVVGGKLANDGKIVSKSGSVGNIDDIQGDGTGIEKAIVRGSVPLTAPAYAGHTVIVGADGKRYFQEPTDPKVLSDPLYISSQLRNVGNVFTGVQDLNIYGNKSIQGGKYEARYVEPKSGSKNPPLTELYQGDTLMYIYDHNTHKIYPKNN